MYTSTTTTTTTTPITTTPITTTSTTQLSNIVAFACIYYYPFGEDNILDSLDSGGTVLLVVFSS